MSPAHRRCVAAVLVVAGVTAVAPARAHGYRLGAITIGHFWCDPAGPGDRTTGVYGILLNGGAADALVGASTPVAARVRFREKKKGSPPAWFDEVALAPGRPAVLAGWRRHLWLVGLKRPLKAGTSFPLTLVFRRAGRVTIQIAVGREGAH